MGQAASSVSNFLSKPYKYAWSGRGSDQEGDSKAGSVIPRGAMIFVYKRQGSMYFDEDGDLAHEFYCEVRDRKTKRIVMHRTFKNLVPQGEVEFPHPRLNADIPVIMYDASSLQ